MRGLLVLVLLSGCAGELRANSAICSVSSGNGPLTNTACGQTFVANDFLNWGAPVSSGGLGQAIETNGSPDYYTQPVQVTSYLGDGITVTSPGMNLVRADNTVYAWDGTTAWWELPSMTNFGETINTFGGQFNAPNYDATSAPYGPNNYPYQFGDPLLGAVGSDSSGAQMDFSFSKTLYGLSFELSSATAPNFIATLDAYDSSGHLLGVYQVNGTGDGGTCAGLNNPSFDEAPRVCNDAATIQFYDPEGNIARVVLTVNDDTGAYVDQLSMDTSPFSNDPDSSTPEPGTAPLIGAGLFVLAAAAKYKYTSR